MGYQANRNSIRTKKIEFKHFELRKYLLLANGQTVGSMVNKAIIIVSVKIKKKNILMQTQLPFKALKKKIKDAIILRILIV